MSGLGEEPYPYLPLSEGHIYWYLNSDPPPHKKREIDRVEKSNTVFCSVRGIELGTTLKTAIQRKVSGRAGSITQWYCLA